VPPAPRAARRCPTRKSRCRTRWPRLSRSASAARHAVDALSYTPRRRSPPDRERA
jgi:hypothetical protein